jgi:SAM-dependent methyltransferase
MKRRATTTGLAERLAALSEPIRLRICRLLERHELSVGEVANVVQLPQSTVSRHLKVLSSTEWVLHRAEGTAKFYRLVLDDLPDEARAIWRAVRDQLGTDPQFEEDAHRLAAVLAERKTDSLSFFGRVAGEWDKLRMELFGDAFTAHALLGLLPPDWIVADIGCGTGNAAEMLAPHVAEVVAIDRSSPMLSAAQKRLSDVENVRFVEASIESLPLDDDSVDAATCLLVLHHVERTAARRSDLAEHEMPGLMALRKRVRGQAAAEGRADRGLAAHDGADGGADRDARRARRRGALGVVQHLQHAGLTPRRRSSSGPTARPRPARACRCSPGRARRSRSTGGARARSFTGRWKTERRPEPDPRRRRRRDDDGAQGGRVREGRRDIPEFATNEHPTSSARS